MQKTEGKRAFGRQTRGSSFLSLKCKRKKKKKKPRGAIFFFSETRRVERFSLYFSSFRFVFFPFFLFICDSVRARKSPRRGIKGRVERHESPRGNNHSLPSCGARETGIYERPRENHDQSVLVPSAFRLAPATDSFSSTGIGHFHSSLLATQVQGREAAFFFFV